MSFERKTPVILVCCGSLNPVTIGHLKMFEIARNFMERMGTHIVIGGVLSPVHDGYKKLGLLPAKHRVEMCRLAVQRHPWLSVDSWESDQVEWVETVKVLQHQANKIKETYGHDCMPIMNGSRSPYSPTQTAVTLQPGADGLRNPPISFPLRSSAGGQNSVPIGQSLYHYGRQSGSFRYLDKNESLELNEASEPSLHDKTGIVLDKLSQNLRRVCCARPLPFDLQGNMIYGATCDFRHAKVMLLCGGDLLQSFATPGLWKEEHIREIVSDYGIVCIPRQQTHTSSMSYSALCGVGLANRSQEDKGEKMRKALDRLHTVTRNISGTIILVNDIRTPEIAHISSTRCRAAIMNRSPDASSLVYPNVLNYIQRNNLYMQKVAG